MYGRLGGVVDHHADVLDRAVGGGQRQQGDVLVHKVGLPGDRLVVLEVHQVRMLFPQAEGAGAQLHHGVDLAPEPGLVDFREQAEQRLAVDLIRAHARMVLHKAVPHFDLVLAVQHDHAHIDALDDIQ